MSYWLCRWLSWLWFKVLYRMRSEGAEHIPERGGVLVAANHASYLDPMAFGAGSRRMLHFLARGSLETSRLYRFLTARLPIVPIDRGAGDRVALRTVVEVLQRGDACLVFPEGTRTSDGRLGELKGGVLMMARMAGVPIVPAHIGGTYEIWPRHASRPRLRGRMTVRFGAPLDLAELPKEQALGRLRQAMTDLGAGDAIAAAPGSRPTDRTAAEPSVAVSSRSGENVEV